MIKMNLPMTVSTQSLAGVPRPTDVKDYPIAAGNYFSVFDPEWLTKYERKEATRIEVYENTIHVINMYAENYEALVRFFHFQFCEAVVYKQATDINSFTKWAVVCDDRIPNIKWLNTDFCFLAHFSPHPSICQKMKEDYAAILEGLRNRC